MAEALWVAAAGVDYSADEDRRLISSIWTPGIISGLAISAGTGLAASVSTGRCVIPDGLGGGYLCYFDTATPVSGLTASTTNNLYVTVNPTNAQVTVVKGTTPATPNIRIGAAVTSATGVTSTSRGVMAGLLLDALTQPSLTIPGSLVATSAGVQAPKGIRLGAAANMQMRYSVMACRGISRQLITASTWASIQTDLTLHGVNDYGGTSVYLSGANQGKFVAPVAGSYQFSGHAHFVNQTGTTNTKRQMRALIRRAVTSDGVWQKYGTQRDGGTNFDYVTVDGLCWLRAGDTVEFQVWHDENHSVYLSDNQASPTPGAMDDGTLSYGMLTLISTD